MHKKFSSGESSITVSVHVNPSVSLKVDEVQPAERVLEGEKVFFPELRIKRKIIH